MGSSRVFVCHASEDKAQAERIALSLRGRGFKVFLDKDDLPAGHSYDERIQKAVKRSSAFVFLISPDSVKQGRYTLTELRFASQNWPNPSKSIVPVMIAPTELSILPEYLKAVTILKPHGNVGAEVSAAVASVLRPSRLRLWAAVLIVLAVGLLIYLSLPRPFVNSGDTPPISRQYIPDDAYGAAARCSKTGKIGHGTGSTREEASSNAVDDCINQGGLPGCCTVQRIWRE